MIGRYIPCVFRKKIWAAAFIALALLCFLFVFIHTYTILRPVPRETEIIRQPSLLPFLVTNFQNTSNSSNGFFIEANDNKPRRSVALNTQQHFFWRGRQKRLCKLIKQKKKKAKVNKTTILLNLTTSCVSLPNELQIGTGNMVLGFYGMRIAAMTHGVDFLFRCTESENGIDRKTDLFWWLQGQYGSPLPSNGTMNAISMFDSSVTRQQDTCRGMGHNPINHASEFIRLDLRKLAVGIYGARPSIQGSELYKSAESETPLLPSEPLDEVAIHFRCGDILLGVGPPGYGFIKFQSYKERISVRANTIGIVTQSFDPTRLRQLDALMATKCKTLVMALKKYLLRAFPNSIVTIRNGPHETIPTAFARLVMANQTFSGPSTFGVFPTVASFGTGYIQKGEVNYFASPIADIYNNIELMTGPILASSNVQGRSIKSIVQWLIEPI